MSNEITRENVQAFLDSNAVTLKEEALESQARQLRLTINGNHTARTLTEAQKKALAAEESRKRRAARMEARAKAQARENAAVEATRQYIKICAIILLATALTPFPWWGFLALTAGLAVFPTVYIFRLYYPMEGRS